MYPAVKIDKSIFQTFSIFLPHHPVYPWCRLPLQTVIAASEQIDVDVMQQRRELQLLVPFCCLTHTVQPA